MKKVLTSGFFWFSLTFPALVIMIVGGLTSHTFRLFFLNHTYIPYVFAILCGLLGILFSKQDKKLDELEKEH